MARTDGAGLARSLYSTAPVLTAAPASDRGTASEHTASDPFNEWTSPESLPFELYEDPGAGSDINTIATTLQRKGKIWLSRSGDAVWFEDLDFDVQCGLVTYVTRPNRSKLAYLKDMPRGAWSDYVATDINGRPPVPSEEASDPVAVQSEAATASVMGQAVATVSSNKGGLDNSKQVKRTQEIVSPRPATTDKESAPANRPFQPEQRIVANPVNGRNLYRRSTCGVERRRHYSKLESRTYSLRVKDDFERDGRSIFKHREGWVDFIGRYIHKVRLREVDGIQREVEDDLWVRRPNVVLEAMPPLDGFYR